MLYKIDAARLRPGMRIVDTGSSWLKQPYLYSVAGELTEWELAELLREGYTEAFIDLANCRPGSLPPDLEALAAMHIRAMATDSPDFVPPPPRVVLEEELPRARAVFRSSLAMARNLMDGARAGKRFDPESAVPVVEDMLDSLDRNADALFGLCKLRQADDYTYTHCVNVSVLTAMFSRCLGLDRDTLRGMALGGLLHDVGKSMIPLRILLAPRRLSAEEMDIAKRHPLLGHAYLQDFTSAPDEVFQAVLEHHEQFCGQGYPYGLSPENISLAGRVTATVDVFDALTSRRVYSNSMPLPKSLSIIYSMAGKQLFAPVVEMFIRLLGVYPMGSVVELEDGSIAVVAENHAALSTAPEVVLVRDRYGRSLGNVRRALSSQGSPAIVGLASAPRHDVDPAAVLRIAP